MKKRPILITGIHRSGSTWLGKVMGVSSELRYIHEPFNVAKNIDIPFSHWYKYVSDCSSKKEQEVIKKYVISKQSLNIHRLIDRSRKAKYLGQVKDAIKYELKYFIARPLIKDPIAFMAMEWIQKTFDADIIVLIRHPAAFIASLKVKDWRFDFKNLLSQDLLMEKELAEYKSEIEEIVNFEKNTGKSDLILQGILLWNCIYSITKKRNEKYQNSKNWIFVKHEDLSLHPKEELNNIFSKFNLKFTKEIQLEIENTTYGNSSNIWARDSVKNISTWKDRLDKEEIKLIKKKTFKIWNYFYDEDDW